MLIKKQNVVVMVMTASRPILLLGSYDSNLRWPRWY